jgi:hypothetical protein
MRSILYHRHGRASIRRQQTPVDGAGQAVVEFAIILPVLLLLLVGLINIGFLIHAQIILTHAAWEGARAGATLDAVNGEGDDQIVASINRGVRALPHPENVRIEIDPDEMARLAETWPSPRGDPLTIRLEYPLVVMLPVRIEFTLRSQAVSRIEYSNPP